MKKKVINILLVLGGVILSGIMGYMLIERWTFIDAAYMTIITLTSVGFGEIHPLSTIGRVFTIFLILGGVGALFYGISVIAAFIIEGGLRDLLKRRTMDKLISNLNDHYIICGAKETGRFAVDEFVNTGNKFVIVEPDVKEIKKIDNLDKLSYLEEDPTKDEVLLRAGIKKAKGLVSALSTDKDNLFVVLSARELNPDLRIVAQAVEQESEPKLLKAGANCVVLPNFIGGLRMASEMIRPTVVSFLDVMVRGRDITLRVEEAGILPGSPFVGQTLGEVEVPKRTGLIVVAIKDSQNGRYCYNPGAAARIKQGDILIVLGSVEQLENLKNLIRG
ncbi:MAG: NAD-binding protein [Candidatus Omnitrophota bacterium]|nr:NAD-binding protein [Candidatus Omnitrophota bacterium]